MSALRDFLNEAEGRAELCKPSEGAATISKKLLAHSQADVPLLISIIRTIDIIFENSPSPAAEILTLAQECSCDVCNVVVGMDNRAREDTP